MGLAFVSIALFVLPRSTGYASIVGILFLLGLGGGIIVTGANGLASDVGEAHRATTLNLVNLFFGLGGFATPFLSANLLSRNSVRLCYTVATLTLLTLAVHAATPMPGPNGARTFVFSKPATSRFTGPRCCCASSPASRSPLGWVAGVRAKAAALVESSGFMDLVKDLLRQAEAVHADETPARAAGGMRYVHLACTPCLTHMHTGDRSADAIDAGGVLPGYQGILVRDGYHQGYGHLTAALHAWCGAHLLRDLKDLYEFEPREQDWARQMAGLLIEARDAARDARAGGKKVLDPDVLGDLVDRYRAIAACGLAANIYRRTATAKDARRIARRFLNREDMILRFITRPDLDIFTNNEAERTIRPVKVAQRASGGCWRTLQGLADFAVVQSYLSTATKWGIPKIDALRGLFNGNPWMPPGLEPALTG